MWCFKEQLKVMLRDTHITNVIKQMVTKLLLLSCFHTSEPRLYSALVLIFSDCGIKLCMQQCDALQHLVCYSLIHYYRKLHRRKDQISFYFNIYLHFPGMEMNTCRFTTLIVISYFFIRTYTVRKLVLLIPGYCLQEQVILNIFKTRHFQLFIHEKLKKI